MKVSLWTAFVPPGTSLSVRVTDEAKCGPSGAPDLPRGLAL